MRLLTIIIFAVAATATTSLSSLTHWTARALIQQEDYEYSKDTSKYRIPAERARGIIEARARETLLAIKNRDTRKLSEIVHPQKGLRLSAYAWVDNEDRKLTREQVRNLFRRDRPSVWFRADESGQSMRMTAREFFSKYIYDNDYLKASRVSYNTQHKRGITIPNVLDFYPRAIVVEYYEPDPDPNQRGWDTLWLVFEQAGNSWHLVGIVKDTPTI